MATRRPGPARWLYYQNAGRLPDSYRKWVLHDRDVRYRATWRSSEG